MAVIKDPEGNETSTLGAMVNLKGLNVLEVGSGDGRLTWRYAGEAARVTAIDPDGEAVATARASVPVSLKDRVQFLESTIEDFARSTSDHSFDVAIFGWSL